MLKIKKIIPGLIGGIILVYFILVLLILPVEYLSQPIVEPRPKLDVKVSDSEINLGDSFVVDTITENQNQQADILITSIGFPDLDQIEDSVRLSSYDFTQSPRNIIAGDFIGSEYTFGNQISANYASIEALSRNVIPGEIFHMSVTVTPQSSGIFEIRTKSIAIPHSSNLSHFPHGGTLDYQGEYVNVHTVFVKP